MIVMKFGGTSVEDAGAINRLVSIVRRHLDRRPIVVVSAMAGATNGFLECARLAAEGNLESAHTKIESIYQHHIKTAEQVALPGEIKTLTGELRSRFDELHDTLKIIDRKGEVTPELSDAVSSQGELLSSPIVAAALRAQGIKGKWIDIRSAMLTDNDFTRAIVDFDKANDLLSSLFTEAMSDDSIPITQGYIGSTSDRQTTTIGRGGSDYSAAIIGAAVNAVEVQIWTDVDGIMTTDPRIVSEATKIQSISFAEAAELAYFGAKVLHPSTLMPAMKKEIPVSVCNSRRPEVEGTLIVRECPPSRSTVKAIAFKKGLTVVNIRSFRMLMAHGFLARIFEVFDKYETPVDMVATSEVSISVTLDDTRRLDHITANLENFGDVTVERDMALICLVGENMKYTPGVASRIFSSIGEINVSMISHGASMINVSFIVSSNDMEKAVKLLHAEFF